MKSSALFSTPLYLSRPSGHDELRAELGRRLVDEARRSTGLEKSNFGGWHSQQDLLTRSEPCYRALTTLLLEGFREALRHATNEGGKKLDPSLAIGGIAWAMVMERGHYTAPHHHGEAHWAGVYYVDAGDQPESASRQAGCLSLLDPRGALEDPLGLVPSSHDVRPVDGLLVFFPGWLVHHVHPYVGTRPRISVSCNLRIGPG